MEKNILEENQMKNILLNRHKSVLFFTFIAIVLIVQSLSAQAPRKYKTGDKIDMVKGITYEIIECRIKPNTRKEECDYIVFFPDGSASNTNTSLAFILRRDELAVKAEQNGRI